MHLRTDVCTDVLSVHTHVRRVRTRVGTVRMHVRDARALCIHTVNTHVRCTPHARAYVHYVRSYVLCVLTRATLTQKKTIHDGREGYCTVP